MARNINDTTTLAEIAGTTRGLSKLTVKEVKALLKGKAPAKPEPVKSEFYEKVIVGGREARQNHHKANTAAAAWMREKGIVPSGSAWAAVKTGERDVKTLRSMNEADGLKPMTKKGAAKTKASKAKAPKATPRTKKSEAKESIVSVTDQHLSVTERDIEAEVKTLIEGGFTEAEARNILG